MPRTKLFVSHSTRTDAAKTRLAAICKLLDQAGYEVLVDDRFITSGSQWRERIHLALARCQAALVLFDEQAMESKWVLKEATILGWREALERPRFHFLPVRLGTLSTDKFREGSWSPLNLGEVQHVKSADPVEIVNHVTHNVPIGLEELTAFDRLIRLVARELRDVDDTLLEEAVGETFGHGQSAGPEGWKMKYAELLARRLFEQAPSAGGDGGALNAAVDLLAKLTLDRTIVGRVLAVIRPLWVEGDAAAMLPAAAQRGAHLALYCSSYFFNDPVAPDYVARGYPAREPLWIWTIEDASAGADFAFIRDRMREAYLEGPPPKQLPGELVDRAIQNLRDPVVVAVPNLLGESDLVELRKLYPNVIFLMHTPTRQSEARSLPANCVQIVPELLDQEDFAAFQAKQRAEQLLKRKN